MQFTASKSNWIEALLVLSRLKPLPVSKLVLWLAHNPQKNYDDLSRELPMEYLWLSFVMPYPFQHTFFVDTALKALECERICLALERTMINA